MAFASEEYLLQEPRKHLYYRILILLSNVMGLGEVRWWGYKPNRVLSTVLRFSGNFVRFASPYMLVSQTAYFYYKYSVMAVNVRRIMFALLPVTFYVFQILVSSHQPRFKAAMMDFMDKIHLYNYIGDNEYVKTKYIEMERKTRRASIFLCGFLMVDWLSWSVIPVINSVQFRSLIENRTTMAFETICYVFLPLDYEYNFHHWIIVHSSNIFILWIGCVMIITHVCTNYAFVFQLIGHIEILKHNLKTKFSDGLSDLEVKQILVNIIKHHSFMLKIFGDIQDAFGLNVTSFYMYNMLADSMLLYLVMTGDKRSIPLYGLMIMVYMGGLILMSFILEEIKIQSDDLADLIYGIQWEDWSISNQKIVLLVLMRAQPQLGFTAAFGFKAGVQPMISIVKTTFSYYLMLKQTMS